MTTEFTTPIKWRKTHINAIRSATNFLRFKNPNVPATLMFPLGPKNNMFEMGGQDHSDGFAIIVAPPSGRPGLGKVLHNRWANELHASIDVWPGCVVAMGAHHKGRVTCCLYRVSEILEGYANRRFNTAKLELLWQGSSVSTIPPSPTEGEFSKIPQAASLLKALYEKLFTYNCTEPSYITWFQDISRPVKQHMVETTTKFIDGPKGLDSTSYIAYDREGETFSYMMSDLVAQADEVYKQANYRRITDDNYIVWLQMGYHINEGDLVCEGRLYVSNEDTPLEISNVDESLFIYSDTMDVAIASIVQHVNDYDTTYRSSLIGGSINGLRRVLEKCPDETITTFCKYTKGRLKLTKEHFHMLNSPKPVPVVDVPKVSGPMSSTDTTPNVVVQESTTMDNTVVIEPVSIEVTMSDSEV